MIIKHNESSITPGLLMGLPGLASYVEQDTLIYIIRSMYRIIFKSSRLRESKEQLHKRIFQFEQESGLPGFLSAIPVEQLLKQLDDAQYFYPIRSDEVSLPTFH